MTKRSLMLLALVVTGACAGNTVGTGVSDGTSSTLRANRSSDVIRADELAAANVTNLAEAIQQLRPRFLVPRGAATTGDQLVVYLDGSQLGNAASLNTLHPSEIQEVRYLDGPQASARFGFRHGGGALLVTRKRTPTP